MDCIVCGEGAGGHRVVIEFDSGTPVGGFCNRCETSIFGRCFTRFESGDETACVICGHDGTHVFIDWLDRMGADGAQNALWDIDPAEHEAPVFCATHLQALMSDSADWLSPTDPIQQTTRR